MEGNLQNSASKRPNHRCLGFPRYEHVLDQQDGDEDQSRLGDDVDCADDAPAHDLRIASKSEIRCIFTTERDQRERERDSGDSGILVLTKFAHCVSQVAHGSPT
jgi:hypothetical protein